MHKVFSPVDNSFIEASHTLTDWLMLIIQDSFFPKMVFSFVIKRGLAGQTIENLFHISTIFVKGIFTLLSEAEEGSRDLINKLLFNLEVAGGFEL